MATDPHVILPRRNFLVRALGITTAGATVGLPLVTVPSARARAQHHVEGLKMALEELYPQSRIEVGGHFPEGDYADPRMT